MMKKMVEKAVAEKVGTSKVVDTFKEAYDYIIVGAGAAGNVLAGRLTENSSNRVLLLEAGGDDAKSPSVHIPVAAGDLQNSDFNYNYQTVTQQNACRNMDQQQASYPRGKGLGGSSSINYLSYTRGSRYDFDEWAEIGCNGWSYKDVLPYFMKCEGNSNTEYVKSGYHGVDGPMKISDLETTPLVELFLNAGQELGYPIVDVNGANQLGFSNGQGNINNGMRWSTAHAYLRPAMERPNLDVAIKSQVSKLLFNKNEVTGVEILKDDKHYQVRADKEVIISAGAIESPKILMLSGIGPKEQLAQFGIPVRADLPVGKNLQDHPMCVVEYVIEKPLSINVDQAFANKSSKEYQEFLFFTSGYLGMAGSQGACAFFRSRMAPTDKLYPDIYVQMSSSLIGGIFRKRWNLKKEIWEELHQHERDNKHGIYLTSVLLHPKSVGSVQLQSTAPEDAPLIDPRFLEHPEDARVLVEGLKMQLQLSQTDAFSRVGAHPNAQTFPGSQKMVSFSDSYLEKYVRHHTLTGHHASGTCRMGSVQDRGAVVDPDLRVIGIKRLRVIDASVMPKVPSGNTGAPTIMIAEKASDIILGQNSVSDIKIPDEVLENEEVKEKARKTG